MNTNCLKNWNRDDFMTLEEGVVLASHSLDESGLFSDESLERLLDEHPEDALTISTMGTDTNKFEWRECERDGVSANDLLDLVKQGRLWMNARNVLDHHPAIAEAVDAMYDEMERKSPGFQATERSANLLISSPSALVHYHIDMPVNMLWHIRGRKRVWVYPSFDFRFCSQIVIEKVCVGQFSDDVPYVPEFDKFALVFDVEPGQMLTWPQMTPHRVTNLEGLNVSLSTEHKNPRACRRINVHEANFLLRKRLGKFCRSANVDSWSAHAKQFVARAARLSSRVFGKERVHFVYPKTLRVDPTSPTGVMPLDGTVFVAPHEAEAAEA